MSLVKQMDIRGQVCPSTLLAALREINQQQESIRDGALILEILTDNRHATATVPDAVRNMGLTVKVEKVEGSYLIRIQSEVL